MEGGDEGGYEERHDINCYNVGFHELKFCPCLYLVTIFLHAEFSGYTDVHFLVELK